MIEAKATQYAAKITLKAEGKDKPEALRKLLGLLDTERGILTRQIELAERSPQEIQCP